jgi:polyribonucleotide nucleotidyltransferase
LAAAAGRVPSGTSPGRHIRKATLIPPTFRRDIPVGTRTVSIETGKLAKQADGAVIVRSGDTMVIVTACHAANARVGIDFLPLTVDYREYTYASGRIPGGFFKREGKPAEKEVLTSRLIVSPIRPLFPSGWFYETQIVALLIFGRRRERLGCTGDHGRHPPRSRCRLSRFLETIAGVRVGLSDGPT